ncbi:MAG: hypothetical protein HQL22_07585 [Candidatus Omnitrophica bacterium]|nr:hypothetical protein [Candidatus Omnitrophota bacterium]
MADDKKVKKEKKGFWANLMDKVDQKMSAAACSGGCCCGDGDKKKDNKCC